MNNNNMKEEKHRLGCFFFGGGVLQIKVYQCTILSNCDPFVKKKNPFSPVAIFVR